MGRKGMTPFLKKERRHLMWTKVTRLEELVIEVEQLAQEATRVAFDLKAKVLEVKAECEERRINLDRRDEARPDQPERRLKIA